jgi:DNA-binding MarR family transcriptional regulator
LATDDDLRLLIVSLLQGFVWFDEGLQAYLRARSWPAVTRPQSMVMANIAAGVRRPSEIARRLGVSRQAIHSTIGQMVELGILELVADPADGRVKVVALSDQGEAMRRDAQAAMAIMTRELGRRIGPEQLGQAAQLLAADWGPPMTFGPDDVAS